MSRNRVRTLEEALAMEARFKKIQERQLADIANAKELKSHKAANPSARSASKNGAGEVRIIGGQWRRTKLSVAQRPGLRVAPAEASLEDVFISLIGQAQDNFGGGAQPS